MNTTPPVQGQTQPKPTTILEILSDPLGSISTLIESLDLNAVTRAASSLVGRTVKPSSEDDKKEAIKMDKQSTFLSPPYVVIQKTKEEPDELAI